MHGGLRSDIGSIRLKPEFWRTSNRSVDVRKCPKRGICTGDDAPGAVLGAYCAPGLDLSSIYCQTCEAADSYLDNSVCRPCGPSRTLGFTLLGVFCGFLLLLYLLSLGCCCFPRLQLKKLLRLRERAMRFIRREGVTIKFKQVRCRRNPEPKSSGHLSLSGCLNP